MPIWRPTTSPAGSLVVALGFRCRIENVYPRGDFAFAPDGQRLAAPKNGEDSAVGVWDVITGREIATLRAPGTVASLAFGAEGGRLAIGAWDRRRDHWEVAIWDVAARRVIRRIDAGPHPIRGRRLQRRRPTGRGWRGGRQAD